MSFPKRAFVRGLFGQAGSESGTHAARQRASVERDLVNVRRREVPFNLQYVTYVFGSENEAMLRDLGCLDVRLLDTRPYVFAKEYLFRNKMELIKAALLDFDEIIWLDWDCNVARALPHNLWERMYSKEPIQACLHQYRRKLCFWRRDAKRKVANSGFLYIRDKSLMPEVLNAWETTGRSSNDEIAITYVIDRIMGGWKGVANYWERFEPVFCQTKSGGPYPDDWIKQKEIYFHHHFGPKRRRNANLNLQPMPGTCRL